MNIEILLSGPYELLIYLLLAMFIVFIIAPVIMIRFVAEDAIWSFAKVKAAALMGYTLTMFIAVYTYDFFIEINSVLRIVLLSVMSIFIIVFQANFDFTNEFARTFYVKELKRRGHKIAKFDQNPDITGEEE